MIVCQHLTSLCIFMSQHCHLPQCRAEFDYNGGLRTEYAFFTFVCASLPSTERGTIGHHVDTQGSPVPGKLYCPRQGAENKKQHQLLIHAEANIQGHIDHIESQALNLCGSTSNNICLLLQATNILIKLNIYTILQNTIMGSWPLISSQNTKSSQWKKIK